MMNLNLYKMRAFNLAEILLTLSMVGIITVIIIPIIFTRIQEIQSQVALKAIFSTLSNASNQAKFSNCGTLSDGLLGVTGGEGFFRAYKNYMDFIKTCEYGTSWGNCWHNNGEFFFLDGSPIIDENLAGAVLSNGMMVQIRRYSVNDCTPTVLCLSIRCDINGLKGPNTMGKDIFYFEIFSDRIAPYGNGKLCDATGENCSSYYILR